MPIAAAPLPPPVIVQPAARQVWYGIVRGTAPQGTQRIIVRVNGGPQRSLRLRGRRFVVDLDLPVGRRVVRVEAIAADGRRSVRSIKDVISLPRAARPRDLTPHVDPLLQRQIVRLARSFGRSSGIYVEDLTTGAGAGWNARATFPGASALKLAIAVTALARLDGVPAAGSRLDRLFMSMLAFSDNASANALETVFGGSTRGGSALVNETMRSIGLESTEMYGGYIIGTSLRVERGLAGTGIPLTVVDQPSWGIGKKTTALDLARLSRSIWLATGARGPLHRAQRGFTPADARYLLWVLSAVRDHGKLDRFVSSAPDVKVFHKAGWIKSARHDNGLVVWRGGILVATVMTYRSWGTGPSSDVLAGRVAQAALRRVRG